MEVVALLLLACNVLLVSAAGGGYGVDWNYKLNGVRGPAFWKVAYGTCEGNKQSPINILTHHVQYNKDLGSLSLYDYTKTNNVTVLTMKNRDTDIEFKGTTKDGSKMPQMVEFKGTKYRFYQFHFHWGVENFKGSEHLVDWQRSAAEMHIIHYNDKYASVSEAIDKSDGLLVWGHFLRVNSIDHTENKAFGKLLAGMGSAESCCNTTDIEMSLYDLLPASHDKFFTYSGGLTTPPCYESVRWVVNKDPIVVSENQMKKFRALKDSKVGGPIRDNFRPPQPLKTRIVEANFSKAGIITPCALTILIIVAAMIINF